MTLLLPVLFGVAPPPPERKKRKKSRSRRLRILKSRCRFILHIFRWNAKTSDKPAGTRDRSHTRHSGLAKAAVLQRQPASAMLEATRTSYYDQSAGNQTAYAGALGATDGGKLQQQQQAVGAGPRPSLLSARAQAEAAQSLAMRPAENVPVYVMLPLDTVRNISQATGVCDCQSAALTNIGQPACTAAVLAQCTVTVVYLSYHGNCVLSTSVIGSRSACAFTNPSWPCVPRVTCTQPCRLLLKSCAACPDTSSACSPT